MGHGDTLAIVDANYPSWSHHRRVHTLAGLDTTEAARMILRLFPVDEVAPDVAFAMVPDAGAPFDDAPHQDFARELAGAEGRTIPLAPIPRTEFYSAAGAAYAAVRTSDLRPFSCFLLVKGVV
jgi:L-fucose mutarotase